MPRFCLSCLFHCFAPFQTTVLKTDNDELQQRLKVLQGKHDGLSVTNTILEKRNKQVCSFLVPVGICWSNCWLLTVDLFAAFLLLLLLLPCWLADTTESSSKLSWPTLRKLTGNKHATGCRRWRNYALDYALQKAVTSHPRRVATHLWSPTAAVKLPTWATPVGVPIAQSLHSRTCILQTVNGACPIHRGRLEA